MIKLWKGKWTLQDAIDNPDKYFVFGDNDQRRGNGGQACIRPAKNSIGIRTKKYPSIDKGTFYTDNEFQENVRKIDEDINKIEDIAKCNTIVYLAENRYGNGLARLKQKAPKTDEYLWHRLNVLYDKWNYKVF